MCCAYVWPRLVQSQGKKLTLLLMLHIGYSSPSVIALVYDFTLLYKNFWFHPVTYGGRHDCFRFWKHPSSFPLCYCPLYHYPLCHCPLCHCLLCHYPLCHCPLYHCPLCCSSALKILVETENDRLVVLYHKGLHKLGEVRQTLILYQYMTLHDTWQTMGLFNLTRTKHW